MVSVSHKPNNTARLDTWQSLCSCAASLDGVRVRECRDLGSESRPRAFCSNRGARATRVRCAKAALKVAATRQFFMFRGPDLRHTSRKSSAHDRAESFVDQLFVDVRKRGAHLIAQHLQLLPPARLLRRRDLRLAGARWLGSEVLESGPRAVQLLKFLRTLVEDLLLCSVYRPRAPLLLLLFELCAATRTTKARKPKRNVRRSDDTVHTGLGSKGS